MRVSLTIKIKIKVAPFASSRCALRARFLPSSPLSCWILLSLSSPHREHAVVQSSVGEFLEGALKLHDDRSFHLSLERLCPLAEGSSTARRLLRARMSAVYGEKMMLVGDVRAAAIAFAAAYRLDGATVRWEKGQVAVDALTQFSVLASDAAESPEIRADSLLVSAYLHFTLQELPKGLIKLRLAQQIQPTDSTLWNIEGCILAMLMKKGEALAAFNKAKFLGSEDIEHTLFHRAVLMTSPGEVKEALEEFVARAPRDNRKVPEAYYRLVELYATSRPPLFGAARRFYDFGIAADAHQLSVFEEDEGWRDAANALVGKFQPCGDSKCQIAGEKKCSRCKQVCYCPSLCRGTNLNAQRQKQFKNGLLTVRKAHSAMAGANTAQRPSNMFFWRIIGTGFC